MDEAEAGALERDVSLDAAPVFAVAPERVAAGGELHPDLMGAAGVEGDVCEAGAAVRGRRRKAVFQHSLLHALAGAADREDPAPPAVLK